MAEVLIFYNYSVIFLVTLCVQKSLMCDIMVTDEWRYVSGKWCAKIREG